MSDLIPLKRLGEKYLQSLGVPEDRLKGKTLDQISSMVDAVEQMGLGSQGHLGSILGQVGFYSPAPMKINAADKQEPNYAAMVSDNLPQFREVQSRI